MKYGFGLACGFSLIGLAVWQIHQDRKVVPPPTTPPSSATTEQARFQLVSGSAYGLALDTKTGMLCHTFEMVDAEKHLPQCVELFANEKQIVGKMTLDPSTGKPFDWDAYPLAK